MKKVLSLVLALCLILALVSCGKGGATSSEVSQGVSSTISANPKPGDFVKPAQYATVLEITINPQFRMYLDENRKVLAVEAVNADAATILDSVRYENESFETVVENMVTAANQNGFVKKDATVHLEIVESKEADSDKVDILEKAEKKAKDTAQELKIEIKTSVGEIKPSSEATKSQPASSQATKSQPTTSQATLSKNPSSTAPVHTHSFSAATCTEPKKCSCGAVEGTALGHSFQDGVCTRCQAKDPNFKPLALSKKQGKWTQMYLYENEQQRKELHVVSLALCNPDKYGATVDIGDPLSSLPESMQKDPDVLKYCEKYNGEYYYIGKGDGDDLKSVVEDGLTVTLTDLAGNKLVLARTGENTLKCTSAPKEFAYCKGIPVGSVFTFVAD